MGRYRDWTNTVDNIANRIIDIECSKTQKAFDKAKKLILEFSQDNKYKGSYTDKVLFVRSKFGQFCKHYNLTNNQR
jgi:hypothetical protein